MPPEAPTPTPVSLQGLRSLWPLLAPERRTIGLALLLMLINAGLTLLVPWLLARGIDRFVAAGDFGGVLQMAFWMLLALVGSGVASYRQILLMGSVGQRVLHGLRGQVFGHLQALPLGFFQQHKAGDLMARINNDTEKLNQFFSETLVRLIGSLAIMFGAALFMLSLEWHLGLAALLPVLLIVGFTRVLTPWLRRANQQNLKQAGLLSAHIQESLSHFQVLAAFNRRDYFRERFAEVNQVAYAAARRAGVANQVFTPVFDFVFQLARLAVLAYGLQLIAAGELGVGLLIAYFAYLNRFYEPLRQMASLWASLQTALASWERVQAILQTPNPLQVLPESRSAGVNPDAPVLCFDKVSFGYDPQQPVLKEVSFSLETGKTYALVGPTGGGKSTTAALMARLYDPDAGQILFQGRDLRCLSPSERAAAVGFILQEPFLFSGSLYENLVYGHPDAEQLSPEALLQRLAAQELDGFLSRFDRGLDTAILPGNHGLSLGQQQLVAFVRAVLRQPALLILDEATANIDTLTEQWLQAALDRLPAHTTRVLIAHRLNTIANADQIFFVNAGELLPAGDLDAALHLLQTRARQS
ncbi:MAG: ABC transporter ATP-binding protein [Candidatus Sericytochromatia bacterium]|nr:ABC transporter ATP-binding protein [Candidatus Sericytochromatia bacterium]